MWHPKIGLIFFFVLLIIVFYQWLNEMSTRNVCIIIGRSISMCVCVCVCLCLYVLLLLPYTRVRSKFIQAILIQMSFAVDVVFYVVVDDIVFKIECELYTRNDIYIKEKKNREETNKRKS